MSDFLDDAAPTDPNLRRAASIEAAVERALTQHDSGNRRSAKSTAATAALVATLLSGGGIAGGAQWIDRQQSERFEKLEARQALVDLRLTEIASRNTEIAATLQSIVLAQARANVDAETLRDHEQRIRELERGPTRRGQR